jgi:hypothetical protein
MPATKKGIDVFDEEQCSYCARSTISAIGAFVFTDSMPFLQPSFDS